MTAPSIIKPKSSAPKLIRLPLTPNKFISIIAKSIASGITDATINPALTLPKKSTRMNITISAPSSRFFSTVLMALFTIFVLSRNGSIFTPSGKFFSICAIRSFTALITVDEFWPFSIITTAPATSPSSLKHIAPYRLACPILTSAISFTRTGIPVAVFFTIIFEISSRFSASPSLRMNKRLGPFSM